MELTVSARADGALVRITVVSPSGSRQEIRCLGVEKRESETCYARAALFSKMKPSYSKFVTILIAFVSALGLCQEAPESSTRYVPPEFQASDAEVKALIDSATESAANGKYSERTQSLQKALARCEEKGFIADKGIVEDHLGVAYASEGKVEEATKQWANALSDGINSQNLVLQADVLVGLSVFSQQAGNVAEALDLANRALELARKSKNLYLESRALGELGRLQLALGKKADAAASVEEALRIDRLNKYEWETGHLLYLAWITAAEPDPNLDKALEIATSARNLAIQKENYLVFVQASTSLGQMYVRKGQVTKGIDILERTQNGASDNGEPLFKRPASYRAAVALPFLRVVLLEAVATAYQTGQRSDEALKTWQQLYDAARTSGFTLAAAEAVHAMADLYNAKKDYDNAISYYSLAAQAWATGGNQQRRIAALSMEASLLFQQGQKGRASQVDEELLPLTKAAKNVSAQFITDVALAETLDGTDQLDRAESALKDAESLVSPDVKVPGVQPNIILEVYIRLADLYEKRRDVQQVLIALEKGLTPAVALENAPKESKNDRPVALVVQRLESQITANRIREAAETAYSNGRFGDALVFYELLQYFDEFDAAWKGRYEEYKKDLNSDPTLARLLQIPPKVISQDDGTAVLTKNIENMGLVAGRVRPVALGLLAQYYMSHQRPDMLVKFARQALSLGVDENDQWSVAMSCELAYGLMMEKDLKSAVEVATHCMTSAKKLGIPQLLQIAHQTNVWVLEATGKREEAQESIQFLLKQKPDDPLQYAQIAQLKAEQGDRLAAIDAWKKAIQLFEAVNNLGGAADAHLAIANLLIVGGSTGSDEKREHLEAADSLYRRLRSTQGRVTAETSLGAYYATQKNNSKAQQYFEGALKIARDGKRRDLEAGVLSQIGESYESSSDPTQATEYYEKSADIYRQLNDSVNEAFQLRNLARILDDSHKPEEALQTILRAKSVADTSGSWIARYWVRRFLAVVYAHEGEYQSGLTAAQEAKQISDTANQPLASAWAGLDLADGFEIIGSWQEALEQLNLAVPVFQQFKDTDNEYIADLSLMSIYGSRESELKDLPKALEFYQTAYQLITKTHPERIAALDLETVEIYWSMRRYKDGIIKANEALEYYKKLKDQLGEASALLGLAELQCFDGDLQAAALNLSLAEPLVKRTKNFYTTGRLYYGKARLYRAQGKPQDAIEQYEQVIRLVEQFKSSSTVETQLKASEKYDFIYDELIDTYYSLGATDKRYAQLSAEKALEYAELNKSRVFARSWGQAFIEGLKKQVPSQLRERERVLLAEQATLQSELEESMAGAAHKPEDQIEKALGSTKKEQSELIQQLREASPAYAEARYPQPVELAQIPVNSGELLIEFKMLQDSVLVWMLGTTDGRGHVVAFYKVDRPRQWFEDRVVTFRDAFNSGHPERFDPKMSEEVFNSLFPEPFAQHLTTAQSVVFIPDDILFLLPFEMLSPRASQGQFVLLKTATEYFPSAAVFKLSRAVIHERQSAWQEQFIGIADPVTSPDDARYVAATILSESKSTGPEPVQSQMPAFRGISVDRIRSGGFALERLPDSSTEVNSIASLFPGGASTTEIRTGVNATKRELMQTDLGRFRFVHFATHGILPVEAGIKEPALVLSYEGTNKDDMLLTLSEVFQLKLRADMVVLSACNTGSGKVTRAEGVASLGTAFLAAGASSVTMSLWHVADNSTAILMQEFYRNLLKGLPKAASLAAARSELVSRGYDNPFFWAPFVLTGE